MRLTREERQKLRQAGIARHGAKHAALAMGMRFGSTPISEPSGPIAGIPYDTLSDYDKRVFEGAMTNSRSNDIIRSETARQALSRALKISPIYTNALANVPTWQLLEGVWKVLKFAGLLTEGEFGLPDASGVCGTPPSDITLEGSAGAQGIQNIDFGARSGGSQSYSVTGGMALNTNRGAAAESVDYTETRAEYHVDYPASCSVIVCLNGAVVDEVGGCNTSGGINIEKPGRIDTGGDGEFHSWSEEGYWFEQIYRAIADAVASMPSTSPCSPNWSIDGTIDDLEEDDEVSVGFRDPNGTLRCDVFPVGDGGLDYSAPTPELGDGGIGPIPGPADPIADIPINDMCDMIHDLKCNPAYQPYLPSPVSPTPDPIPTPSPVPPGPGEPPPPGTIPPPGTGPPGTDPGMPTDPGTQPPVTPGPTPDPGIPPPGTPPIPEPPPIAEPPGDGITDPGDGGCMDFHSDPPGFRDPTQPGGIGKPYQPGECAEIGDPDGPILRGSINRVTPFKGGGGRICIDPPIPPPTVPGDPTKQKICFGPDPGDDPTPVTEAISSLLGDMTITRCGKATVIFDSECDKVLTKKICWPAGTPKKKILDYFLKLCGFCVFPQFDGNVIVGFCKPLNVHWHYHEDVDLLGFDLEYDNKEVYAYVRVYRPDRYNRAGQIVEPGYEIVYPTQTPIAVDPASMFDFEVPFGTPQSQAMSIAVNLAAEMRNQALPLIHFAVPINTDMNLRHQIHIKRPSLGFNAVYMITKIAREYTQEAYLSTGLARWLHAEQVISAL